MFDPAQIADGASYQGNLAEEPMAQLLMRLLKERATGRLSVRDEHGENLLFFMQGRPVGVILSQVVHPLGQLLLELGKVDSTQFVKAQRLIGNGERLPGQVFIEIGAITEADLKDVLGQQARRKAAVFVALKNLPFEFGKGPLFLTGFKSNPMEGAPLVFHALAASMDADGRRAFLAAFGSNRVRARNVDLGAPLGAFGFGKAEERFLQRLADWRTISDLDQGGTLPSEDIAALLRYLQEAQQLESAPPAEPAPAPVVTAPAPAPVEDEEEEAPAPPPPRPRARTATPMPAKANPPPPARRAPPQATRDLGPAPNSGIQVTGTRDLKKREKAAELPSVVVDFDALGVTPRQGRRSR